MKGILWKSYYNTIPYLLIFCYFFGRNDAFDFNVALAEHKGENERELKAQNSVESVSSQPSRDFTLKEGEKIKVKIGTGAPKEKPKSTGGGGFLLAPPPSDSNNKSKGLLAPPPTNTSTSFNNNDIFASSSSSSSSNTTNLLDL